jgi:hypothetical protein
MAIDLDISRWRKVVFFSGSFVTLILGEVLATKEFGIYIEGTKSPRATTGEIYPVSVNHGVEYENYESWNARFSIPTLPALVALITSRDFWQSVREARS